MFWKPRSLCAAAPEPKRRVLGAMILAELGSPERSYPEECCDALLYLVRHDRDLDVLTAAISALGHLRNRRCEPDLIALKNHPNEEIRHCVAFALCGTENPASVQALLELMEDPIRWRATGPLPASARRFPLMDPRYGRPCCDAQTIAMKSPALRPYTAWRVATTIGCCLSLSPSFRPKRENEHLFQDAAKTFLGVDETRMSIRKNFLQLYDPGTTSRLNPKNVVASLWRRQYQAIVFTYAVFAWGARGRRFESCHPDHF